MTASGAKCWGSKRLWLPNSPHFHDQREERSWSAASNWRLYPPAKHYEGRRVRDPWTSAFGKQLEHWDAGAGPTELINFSYIEAASFLEMQQVCWAHLEADAGGQQDISCCRGWWYDLAGNEVALGFIRTWQTSAVQFQMLWICSSPKFASQNRWFSPNPAACPMYIFLVALHLEHIAHCYHSESIMYGILTNKTENDEVCITCIFGFTNLEHAASCVSQISTKTKFPLIETFVLKTHADTCKTCVVMFVGATSIPKSVKQCLHGFLSFCCAQPREPPVPGKFISVAALTRPKRPMLWLWKSCRTWGHVRVLGDQLLKHVTSEL